MAQNSSLLIGTAGIAGIAYPGIIVPVTVGVAALTLAIARVIYVYVKQEEAQLIKEFLTEENQPIIELIISLFTHLTQSILD
jgi:hypothetical protein